MTKIKIFLDDLRNCPDGYFLTTNVSDCINLLKKFEVSHLSLDYDLESHDFKGIKVVEYMIKNRLQADFITVHSANSVGGKKMYMMLLKAQDEGVLAHSTVIKLRPLPL
ncbi:cyclic-phosphate processing receiver domain-containing protein [Pseudalkalibacillus caeni]|uniref:Cyclic-phosphate processing Receiver domain-containing protein n=1 Tax=Exobacillus caeni TaxID=2574798 RepID=A0A5R9F698_9BACL|nr:cyclic-phosphate processing receiver domain-containing protein [Pseudalkalibacillus caeni]TLS37910.1 hypothetical protein FCL54_08820 [Pseudalkalibacillus caeni]